jgi:hypothetical protein
MFCCLCLNCGNAAKRAWVGQGMGDGVPSNGRVWHREHWQIEMAANNRCHTERNGGSGGGLWEMLGM